jgi:hypothetical protein
LKGPPRICRLYIFVKYFLNGYAVSSPNHVWNSGWRYNYPIFPV